MPKLYDELALWWPLLSPPEDYVDEADFFEEVFLESGLPPSPALLELGCGGGSNAFHLKKLFTQVTLLQATFSTSQRPASKAMP
ncbi:MAG TPA: hypothetical protein VEC96_16235 [Anaerolineae bacterium]|nr:hypothetical protein [Anaerolineae bacterium]